MSDPLIEVKELRRHYEMGGVLVKALDGVSFEIKRGASMAIMGPSGSGKSTLMHLLGCLDRPSSGSYRLDGQELAEFDDRALSAVRSAMIGFVFQSFNLIPQLTIEENVALPFLYRESWEEGLNGLVEDSLTRVGLRHRLGHLPTQLSGGEMQRVAIARALAIHPLLILADEPTGNLDTATGRSILELFKELNAQGVTLVIVTHDPTVARHCGSIMEMSDGQILSAH